MQEVVPIDQTMPDFLKDAKAPATRKGTGGKQTKLTTTSTKVASGKHGIDVPDNAASGFVFARNLTKRKVKGTDSDLEDDSDDEAISRGLQLSKPKPSASGPVRSSSAGKPSVAVGKARPRSKGAILPDSSSGAEEDVPSLPLIKRARTEPMRIPATSRPTPIADTPQVPAAGPQAQLQDPIEILDDEDEVEVMALDPSLYRIKVPNPTSFRAASGPIRHRTSSSSRSVSATSITSNRKHQASSVPQPVALQARQNTPPYSPSPPPIRSSQKVHLSLSPGAAHTPKPVAEVAHLPADIAARAGFEEIDPRWILDDDDDDGGYDTSFVPSPPVAARDGHPSGSRNGHRPTSLQHEIFFNEPATPAPVLRPPKELARSVPRMATGVGRLSNEEGQDFSWVLQDDDSDSYESPPIQRPVKRPRAEAIVAGSSPDQIEMPPPASTRRLASTPVTSGHRLSHGQLESPFPQTQPVRRPGFRPKLRAAVLSSPADSPDPSGTAGGSARQPTMPAAIATNAAPRPQDASGAASPRRLFEPPPPNATKGTTRRSKNPTWYRGAVPDHMRPYFDKEAGDDRAERRRRPQGRDDGSDQSSGTMSDDASAVDDEETSSDRAFAGEFQPTQAPRGYDQQRAYMRSVLSPRDGSGGRFSAAWPNGGGAGIADGHLSRPRRFARVASEGPDVDGGAEDDDWDYGTFVVDDEEPLIYESVA